MPQVVTLNAMTLSEAMTDEETSPTGLDADSLFEWQTRQTAFWERWWRKRMGVLTYWGQTTVSEAQSRSFLAHLLAALESSVLHSARLLSGSAFDMDCRFLDRSGHERVRGKAVDDWFVLCEHQVQSEKWAAVQEQIKVSAEAGCNSQEVAEDVLGFLLRFELHCLPVYLFTTLQVVRPLVNETPMLAGLACAQIITGKRHLDPHRNRAELTNALAWVSGLAAPTEPQLRRVLRQEALKSLWVLPFVTLREAEGLKQKRLQQVIAEEPYRLSADQQKRLSQPLSLTSKVLERLTLRYDARTAEALGDLPNSVSHSIISQCERTSRGGFLRVEAEANFKEAAEGGDSLLMRQQGSGKNALEYTLLREEAARYLEAMNEQERVAVLLFSDGYSYAEIASRTCVPVNTVKQRLQRGRNKAKPLL